jgi:peptide chain release factor 2
LEFQSAQDSFWQENNDYRTVVLKRIAEIKSLLEKWETILSRQNDTESAIELLEVEDDKDLKKEVADLLNCNDVNIQSLELDRLLGGPQDKNNAILTINSGAGGTESMDWAEMLYRMYKRWAESYKYKVSVLDFQAGDEAGIKSMTMSIEGEYTYGKLKAEVGVHRLVRISPFDSNKRRHTSFASVFVYPDIENDIDIVINESDLRIDTFRASGAGGQHVNTTDSAIRITHNPTGIVVQCQNERSQHKNKAIALKVLKAALFRHEEKRRKADMDEANSQKKDIAWGSQVRSYVMHPYQLVKDHRTNLETSNVNAVMDGDLDGFIKAILSQEISDQTSMNKK